MIRKVHELLFNFENFTIIFVFVLKTLLAFKVLQQSPLAQIPKLECFHWFWRDLSQLLLRTVLMRDNRLLPSSQGKSYNPFPRDKDLGTIPSPDDKIVSFCSQKYLFSALIRYNHISRPSLFFYPGQETNKKECSKQIVCSFRGRAGRAFCCPLLDFQSQVAVWGSPAGASAQPGLARLEAAAVSESGWPVAALENYLEFQRIKWTQVLCVLEKCFSNCGSQPISIRMTWGVYYRNKFLGSTQTF